MKVLLLGNQADTLYRFRKDFISDLIKLGHKVTLAAPMPSPEILERVRQSGASFIPVNLHRTSLNPFTDLLTFFGLCRLFWSQKPAILFCFTVKPVLYGSLAAWLCGVQNRYSMITGTGYLFMGHSIKHRLLRMIAKILYRVSLGLNRFVFFQNQDDLEMFVKDGWLRNPGKAVLIAGSGVNLTEFPHTPLPTGSTRFLFIGRLLRDKGVAEFTQAAGLLKARYPEACFEILGPLDSNPTGFRSSDLEEWKKKGVVEYLGESPEVQSFLTRCTVFVLPSYREGTPRSGLEALAMGRPIVTTDVPGCRETVQEGQNGFLVPVRDAQDLAKAMERFLLDPALAPRMGRASRALAEEKFDVKKVNQVILTKMGLTINPAS